LFNSNICRSALQIIVGLSFVLIGCNKNEKEEIIEHDFRVFSNKLEKDAKSYYHMDLVDNNNENEAIIFSRTSSDWIQKVGWYCEEKNSNYQINLHPATSYTDVGGETHTVIYPRNNMIGDTIKVFAEYIDENTNLLYTSWISIVLD